jgi:hypothetical protein
LPDCGLINDKTGLVIGIPAGVKGIGKDHATAIKKYGCSDGGILYPKILKLSKMIGTNKAVPVSGQPFNLSLVLYK